MSDFGESMNLIPLFLFNSLSLGNPSPCYMVLQITYRIRVVPEGIIEDVLIKVSSHIPVDFIMLDYDADERVPSYWDIYSLQLEVH